MSSYPRPGLTRRRLLATLGAAGLGTRLAPFLPTSVLAAGTTAPKRMLMVFHPMGYLERSFWPTGAASDGTGFTLGATQSVLAPFKDKLIYPDGLEIYGRNTAVGDNEHGAGMCMVFTGSRQVDMSTGPSVEQAVADFLYAKNKTRFRALGLGVNGRPAGAHSSCFYTGSQTPVIPDNNPTSVFNTVFKDLQVAASGGPDPTLLARLQRQKKSVIDLVKEDLDRVCKQVGAQEKAKCDAHLDGIRMIENNLSSLATSTAATCTKPGTPSTASDLLNICHSQMDLLAAAFACNLTQVVTLIMGKSDGGLDMALGINQHDATHAVDVGGLQKIDRWFADRWLYLFKKLDSYKEGNGSLLDNTLITWGSDTTERDAPHCLNRFTYWMAGGGNFAFKTGRHIKVAPSPGKYAASNRLLVSLCNAFDMNVSKFGNLDPGTGGLPGL